MSAADLLAEYVARHNAVVRGGALLEFMALLAEDANMEFIGLPVGPFVGRAAIESAFRERGPDDELIASDVCELSDATAKCEYRWRRTPAERGGELLVSGVTGRITRIVVTVAAAARRD